MEDNSWIEVLTAIGSVATPILVLFLSSIGWKAKKDIERKVELENKLRDDRIDIYNQILDPFIILLMPETAWRSDKKNKGKNKEEIATNNMLSLEYRRYGFKLALMANDAVVLSYNNLMQHIYNIQENEETDFVPLLKLLGEFLVEIRKSMGNESTKLNHWDMCEWWMSDARKIKNGQL
ncbi:hypothetical protein WH96_18935 [Kiloniella spongiae]|uniref:DUF4760 domain-containing protein n=1 Tax=Kiloniella spongiae TaxID=1489064 RepID=A0A0H2MEQ3_9PROT|nr:hypothetical protein [Kiloniella spongiae]KLN59217.1 hypothetical protein WH96_18935 [Kiloniella spongiae]